MTDRTETPGAPDRSAKPAIPNTDHGAEVLKVEPPQGDDSHIDR